MSKHTDTVDAGDVREGDVILVPMTGKRLVERVTRKGAKVTAHVRYRSGRVIDLDAQREVKLAGTYVLVSRGRAIETPAERKARREASKATRESAPKAPKATEHAVCSATRANGDACTARVIRDGLCIGHLRNAPKAKASTRKSAAPKAKGNAAEVARLERLVAEASAMLASLTAPAVDVAA